MENEPKTESASPTSSPLLEQDLSPLPPPPPCHSHITPSHKTDETPPQPLPPSFRQPSDQDDKTDALPALLLLPIPPYLRPATSTSVPSLRFPRPQGNQHLAQWISSSSPDIMQSWGPAPDSLAASAYEIIHPIDTESSAEDHISESTHSYSDSLADDVQSLQPFDDDESEEEEEASDVDMDDDGETTGSGDHPRESSILYADQALESPSTQHSTASSMRFSNPLASGPHLSESSSNSSSQSIEFSEDTSPVLLDKISVKHTIREYNDDETRDLAALLDIADPPRRLAAAIRQTMASSHLSLDDGPLRVLYVGQRGEMMWSIIGKFASALALPDAIRSAPTTKAAAITAEEAGHMQLYQQRLKIEYCIAAERDVYEGVSFPSDVVYTLTLDNHQKYKSALSPGGSVVQPKWNLPHLAVFFCSNRDEASDETTRNNAWEFATGHGIPSIFISDDQLIDRPSLQARWADQIDQSAVHLCLESRDPDKPNFSRRLPIDLASFRHIDARQMNRNLAYLTGLNAFTTSSVRHSPIKALSRMYHFLRQKLGAIAAPAAADPKASSGGPSPLATIPFFFLLLVVLPTVTVYIGMLDFLLPGADRMLLSDRTSTLPPPAAVTSTVAINVPATATPTTLLQSTDFLGASFASVFGRGGSTTSTRGSSTSEPEASSQEALADQPGKPIMTTCSVESFSDGALLVRMQEKIKMAWLSRNALHIRVSRGKHAIQMHAFPVDEGIVVDIGAKEVHGVLNITLVTSHRPVIHEVFIVHFGKSSMMDAFAAGVFALQDLADNAVSALTDGPRMLLSKVASAFACVTNEGPSSSPLMATSWFNALAGILGHAQSGLRSRLMTVARVQEDAKYSLLRAQIASRLWWLKLRGHTEMFADYQARAARYLKLRQIEIFDARHAREHGSAANGNESHDQQQNTQMLGSWLNSWW